MRYRAWTQVSLALLLAASASACAKQSADPAGEKGGTEPKEQQQPVTLTFFLAANSATPVEELKALYEAPIQAKHPHISLNIVKNENGIDKFIATNTKVDLIFGSFAALTSVEPYSMMGDISDLVKSSSYPLDRFESSYLEAIRGLGKGTLPGLPLNDLRLALYYNKDLFDRFGVSYPKDGMTWEDIRGLAERLTREDGGTTYRGFIAGPNTLLSVNQFGLGFVDPKTNAVHMQDEKWKTFMDTLVPLYTMPGYKPSKELLSKSQQQSDLFFKEQTAAMYVAFNNGAALANKSGLNWDMVSLPEMKGLPGVGSQPYTTYVALSANSPHRDAAFQAMTALVSDENLEKRSAELALLAPIKSEKVRAAFGRDVVDWKGKNFMGVVKQKPASPMPYSVHNNTAQAEMGNAMIQIILGEKDVNTALREAEERATKKIQAAVK